MPAKLFATVALVAATVVAPADALADKTYGGKTQQRRAVSLTTTDDNLVRSGSITWVTRRCSLTDSRFLTRTKFVAPFDSAAPGSFADAGAYTVRQRGGIRSRVSITIAGTYDAVADRWNGTVKATVVVREDGKVVDRCTLRRVYWSATRR
jgi:hypothetical protein